MMQVLLLLLTAIVERSSAEFNSTEYVEWIKKDISQFHGYFPRRALEEERLTNIAAVNATNEVLSGMKDSLSKSVQYLATLLENLRDMVKGSESYGCVESIASYLDNAIDYEISNYEECTLNVLAKLKYLEIRRKKKSEKCESTYSKTMKGIDNCLKSYQNKNFLGSLESCVNAWDELYHKVAETAKYSVLYSPSMTAFNDSVIHCAQQARGNLAQNAFEFIDMLSKCTTLYKDLDPQEYQQKVYEISKQMAHNDLMKQTTTAQNIAYDTFSTIQCGMHQYYELQKKVLQTLVKESRGQVYYKEQAIENIQEYISVVTTATTNYPDNFNCTSKAAEDLQDIVNTAAAAYMECEYDNINQTNSLVTVGNKLLLDLNNKLPSLGNAAILSCYSRGYIFAENTVLDCFSNQWGAFLVSSSYTSDVMEGITTTLQKHDSNLCHPLSSCSSERFNTGVRAKGVLYELNRCMYINNGVVNTEYTALGGNDHVTYSTTPSPNFNTIFYPKTENKWNTPEDYWNKIFG